MNPGFSLIELVVVVSVLVMLMMAGVRLLAGGGLQSRKAGTDLLSGMIEQARTTAITSRTNVLLAIAEPGDLPAGDERCHLGLFKVDAWPDSPSSGLDGVLMSRWRTLETGIALIGGAVDGVVNPLDSPQVVVSYGTAKPLSVSVHAVAFNPRGGLLYPTGSTPVVMRVAEGNYRGGVASPYRRGNGNAITENRLKIGRITARPYRIDG